MNPETHSIPPETPIVGYCRACGKALDASHVRTAHGTTTAPSTYRPSLHRFPNRLTPALTRPTRRRRSPAPMYRPEWLLFWD